MSGNISIGAGSRVNLVKSNMEKIYGRDLELNRQVEDAIEKAGEQGPGSRGGDVIGQTSSGKPIYRNASAKSYKDFSIQDHDEASSHHLKASLKARDENSEQHKRGESVDYRDMDTVHHHANLSEDHDKAARKLEKEKYKDWSSEQHAEAAKNEVGYAETMHKKMAAYKKRQEKKNPGTGEDLKKAEDSTPLNDDDMLDRLEKGQITDMFAYGYGAGRDAKTFTFVKTGKEIKAKIPEITMRLQNTIMQMTMAQTFLAEKIGSLPDTTQTYLGCLDPVPCYSDSMCYVKSEERTEKNDWCCEYNRLNYNICDARNDIAMLGTISNNMEDTKKYELTVSQLVALNF